MVVACLVKKEPEHRLEVLRSDGVQLRNVFLNVKGRLQTFLQRRRNGPPCPMPDNVALQHLSADPANHTVNFRAAAFPPNGAPVVPLPWTMLELQTLASRVPCRSTNRSASVNPFALNGFGRAFSNPMAFAAHQPMLVLAPGLSSGALRDHAADEIGLQVLPRERRPLEALLDRAVSQQPQPVSSRMLMLQDAGAADPASVAPLVPAASVAEATSVAPLVPAASVATATSVAPVVPAASVAEATSVHPAGNGLDVPMATVGAASVPAQVAALEAHPPNTTPAQSQPTLASTMKRLQNARRGEIAPDDSKAAKAKPKKTAPQMKRPAAAPSMPMKSANSKDDDRRPTNNEPSASKHWSEKVADLDLPDDVLKQYAGTLKDILEQTFAAGESSSSASSSSGARRGQAEEPLRVEVLQPPRAEVPEPLQAEVPQPLRAEVPQPLGAEVPQPLQAEVPQRVQAEVPHRVQAEPAAETEPEPVPDGSVVAPTTGLVTMMSSRAERKAEAARLGLSRRAFETQVLGSSQRPSSAKEDQIAKRRWHSKWSKPRFFISGMMGGQFTRFDKLEPKSAIWNDPRIFGCFCHRASGQVGVVSTFSPGGTIYFTVTLAAKTLVVTRGITGDAFMNLPYRPRLKVFDLLTQILRGFDAESAAHKSYNIVVMAGAAGDYRLDEEDWPYDLRDVFGSMTSDKKVEDDEAKPEAVDKSELASSSKPSDAAKKSPKHAPMKDLKKPSKHAPKKDLEEPSKHVAMKALKKPAGAGNKVLKKPSKK
eukprot:Skav220666  [mRNA]  locus=scaffold1914:3339:7764:- [translate_table: standard]